MGKTVSQVSCYALIGCDYVKCPLQSEASMFVRLASFYFLILPHILQKMTMATALRLRRLGLLLN